MSVGNTATQASLNQQAAQIIISLRNNILAVQQFDASLSYLGLQGLINLGFTGDDAQMLLTVFGSLNAICAMVNGNAYTGPALPHNFVQDTIPFWGGN